ncbi:MAG: Hsp20 family protein [Marinilabiliaceae bacterium]|nr:Hsp20 family protein [Marinilabiliaceae bacterium]
MDRYPLSPLGFPFNPVDLFDEYPRGEVSGWPETLQRFHNEYQLELHVPELRKKDLTVHIEGDNLVIEGYRKEKNKHRYYETSFVERFQIMEDMDVDHIRAKYKNGMLSVRVPRKKELTNDREIPVNSNDAIEEATVLDAPNDSWLSKLRQNVQSWWSGKVVR